MYLFVSGDLMGFDTAAFPAGQRPSATGHRVSRRQGVATPFGATTDDVADGLDSAAAGILGSLASGGQMPPA